MRTAVRFTSIFLIFAVAAAASAFAQPAKPGPDGWTTGSGGSTAPQPAAGSAVIPPAQGPPGTVPSRPVVAGGESDTRERNGPFVVGSLGAGQSAIFMADLQLGWIIGSRFSPFVSLGGLAVLEDDGGGISLTGVGARLWFDKLFLEGRVTRGTVSSSCDFDEPCTSQTTHLGIFGLGVELVGSRHVGFEARAQVVTDGRDTVFVGTLGLGLYL